ALDLEVANRDLESFSYTIANDLLSSLLSIGENAKFIQDLYCNKQDDVQCAAYARQIYEKAKNLGQLVGIMQHFFRPTRSALTRETIDLSEMAGSAAAYLRKMKPERRVSLQIADGIMANGDRNMLRVVLTNLFDNAWKHTGTRDEAVIEFGMTDVDG